MTATPFQIGYNCENKLGSFGFKSIGAFCQLLTSEGVNLKDFCELSQGIKPNNEIDDYSVNSLTNSTVMNLYKSIKKEKAVINKHKVIGALPLVYSSLESWTIYIENPLIKLTKKI